MPRGRRRVRRPRDVCDPPEAALGTARLPAGRACASHAQRSGGEREAPLSFLPSPAHERRCAAAGPAGGCATTLDPPSPSATARRRRRPRDVVGGPEQREATSPASPMSVDGKALSSRSLRTGYAGVTRRRQRGRRWVAHAAWVRQRRPCATIGRREMRRGEREGETAFQSRELFPMLKPIAMRGAAAMLLRFPKSAANGAGRSSSFPSLSHQRLLSLIEQQRCPHYSSGTTSSSAASSFFSSLLPMIFAAGAVGLGWAEASSTNAGEEGYQHWANGMEKLAALERQRLEELLNSRGMQRGSYPPFTVDVRGPKVSSADLGFTFSIDMIEWKRGIYLQWNGLSALVAMGVRVYGLDEAFSNVLCDNIAGYH
ncbi:hypothetical protein AXF42_Ash019221 [Apostasia shenzhenica]|uniref:Uncharacterized protein n=1 Tax=Apostasia shenzhenica TaxID=1088818 RepID=A0A2I0A2Y4_9ASPA|nr:hypothetical protein AXF42_Ash019221 [Apostasia shenzhenica]